MRQYDETGRNPDDPESSVKDSCDGGVCQETSSPLCSLAEQEFTRWLMRRELNRMIAARILEQEKTKCKRPVLGNSTEKPRH